MDQFANAAALIQNSVQQNNAWSAQQAQRQMDFQREMSNTAFQRQMADMKAAGLNPILSAKIGGASTPAGAMGGTDTSGTAALMDLLGKAIESSNSAAQAARDSARGGYGKTSTPVEDNSASNLEDVTTTADALGLTVDADGNVSMDKDNAVTKTIDAIGTIPGLGKVASAARKVYYKVLPRIMELEDKAYGFSENSAKQLEENQKRLQSEDSSSRAWLALDSGMNN